MDFNFSYNQLSMLVERIRQTLIDDCHLAPNDTVVIGVSGGPDSVCLLHILWQLNLPMIVAHLDHQIRPESEIEAQFVANLAHQLDLPHVYRKIEIMEFAKRERFSIEEAARIARYQFLFETARERGAHAVITAHNADDQVETVLMHFLRGSGLSGLQGMNYRSLPNPWSNQIPLLRPMLATWREEIMAYLQANRLTYCLDASNLDVTYYRNRLRHELLPALDSYNPGIRRRLWQMAAIIHQDVEMLDTLINQAWNDSLRLETTAYIAFDKGQFEKYPMALQRHLFRRAGYRLRPDIRDLDFNTLQRAIKFVSQPTRSRQMDWLGGLYLRWTAESIWIANREAEFPQTILFPLLSPGMVRSLPVPGQVILSNGWVIRSERVVDAATVYEQACHNSDPYQAWIDQGDPPVDLSVRTRRPGDSLVPLGMKGHSVKISDLMINHKIDKSARDFWPLIVAGNEIVWVPALRLSESFRLKPDSRQATYLRLVPPNQ